MPKKNQTLLHLSFTFSTVPDLMLLRCKGISHIKQNKSKVCIAISETWPGKEESKQ